MKRFILSLAMILTTIAAITAQSPVKWRMTARLTSADAGTITIKATIEQGWHLYSTSTPKDGPVATTFSLDKSTGIKLTGKLTPSSKPLSKLDSNFGLNVSYWSGDVTFTVPFKLTGQRENARVAGSVKFMACDDTHCMPPRTADLSSAVLPAKK